MAYITLEWERDEKRRAAFMQNLAPIALFTYNRPEHTRRTIEALQKNIYAEQSVLYIFSDGSACEQAAKDVARVREYIRSVKGFKEVAVIERKENWGLAKNIIDGVSTIVERHGKIVVLEDDILTSRYFLKFMNDALELYKDEEQVMQISGYSYPIDDLPELFFLSCGDCWGWATWKESWRLFERNPEKLVSEFSEEEIMKFNFNGSFQFWRQVIDNCEGRIYTWAIFFSAAIFKNHGLTLFHGKSLVKNIGLDGSGVHCGVETLFDSDIHDQEVKFIRLKLTESDDAFERICRFDRGR